MADYKCSVMDYEQGKNGKLTPHQFASEGLNYTKKT
jgi:hypothetical protein